mgnify:CR=1 FL=1
MRFIYALIIPFIATSIGLAQFDTTGVTSQSSLQNSYTTWMQGAFEANRDTSNDFDFGWGYYDINVHTILGDSIYIIKTHDGDYKAISIDGITSGEYSLTFSNLDGSGKTTKSIDRTPYETKNFFYYAINDDLIKNPEPATDSWDLVFRRFLVELFPGFAYPVSGVLHNRNVEVSEVVFQSGGSANITDTASFPFSSNISTIGYDWKNAGPNGIVIYDTVTYFVKDQNGNVNKLQMTGYGGSSAGTMDFEVNGNSTQVNLSAGNVNEVYYSLENETELSTTTDHDWDIALFAQSSFSSIPVRINDINGVELWIYPNDDIFLWGSISSTESESKAKASLKLYPIPVSNSSLNYVLESEIEENINVIITSLSGKILNQSEIQLNPGLNQGEIGISDLSSGVYLLKLNGKSLEKTERIIIE